MKDGWTGPAGYLNTALRGLPPASAVACVRQTVELWAHGQLSWAGWVDEVDLARREFAKLVDVAPPRVAVGHTTSALVGIVAANLPDGAVVRALRHEHNSNLIPFLNQAHRGVRVECAEDERELIAACAGPTALIAISLVQSSTGAILDLRAMRAAADRAGALLSIDATQACGWLPFDADLCDVLVCSSYKWLMGPNGPAFACFAPRLAQSLRPLQPNWMAMKNRHASPYGPQFDPADGAPKFDVVPGLVSLSGVRASLEVLNSVGVSTIHRHNLHLARTFCESLKLPFQGSAIVSLPYPRGALPDDAGISVTLRDGRARVAFHWYNDESDVEKAVRAFSLSE